MTERRKNKRKMGDMEELYNRQAVPFADRSSQLFWWVTIGEQAFDRHLGEFYGRKGLQILDLGCASGRVELFLMERGVAPQSFTGVELSPDQVAIARGRIPDATFVVGDITEVDLPPGKFGLAISNMVLEFLDPEQLAKALKNTFGWLRPGGVFFFITTHPAKMKATSGLGGSGVFTVPFPWGGEGSNYYRTVEDFREAVEGAGFVIEALEELNVPAESRDIDSEEYARYKQYPYIRLVVRATKPATG